MKETTFHQEQAKDSPSQREVVALSEPLEYELLFKKYFGNEWKMAYAVAKAESGLRTEAFHRNKNGSVDRGLMQVNSCHCPKVNGNCDRLFEAEENIRVAKIIRDGSGWNAWVIVQKGLHKKYL